VAFAPSPDAEFAELAEAEGGPLGLGLPRDLDLARPRCLSPWAVLRFWLLQV